MGSCMSQPNNTLEPYSQHTNYAPYERPTYNNSNDINDVLRRNLNNTTMMRLAFN